MVSTVARVIISRLLGCILFSPSFQAKLISPLCGETETIQPGNGRIINPFSNVSRLWFRGWGCILSCRLSKCLFGKGTSSQRDEIDLGYENKPNLSNRSD